MNVYIRALQNDLKHFDRLYVKYAVFKFFKTSYNI